ncbi:MAG: SIMPL domain-containing protein [Rhodothermales bacterium]|nr:SIMPL domain-containing protein [Rhodothermales bacterium]
MRHTTVLKSLLLSTILFTLMVTSAHAQSLPTVTVQGEGTVSVDPDEAVVRFGIVTQDEDPEQARARNAKASAEAMNKVRALGVEDSDMRLETLRLQPKQEYNRNTRNYVQVGFEAVREVQVTVKDLEALPTLVAEIIQGGANRLNGVTYQLSDRESVKQDALREAALNARIKATLLAETLGAKVGAVESIAENGISIPRRTFQLETMAMARSADAAAPEPEAYASGQIEVTAQVTVSFFLLNQ